MGEIVIAAHHKSIKCIFRIEVRLLIDRVGTISLYCAFLFFLDDSLIVRDKCDFVLNPCYFSNADFERKQIFFFDMFKACPEFYKDIHSIIPDFVNGQGRDPCIIGNIR